jgi:ABC-type transport system involved in multi-copper enzyme maturation permease subunit
MNALVRKEFRALRMAWIGSLVVTVFPMWFYAFKSGVIWTQRSSSAIYTQFDSVDSLFHVSIFAFALGVLVLALVPFGHELTSKTFNQLLSQPISRRAIWSAKASPLAFAMATNVAAFALSLWLLHAFFSAPFTSGGRYASQVIVTALLAFLAFSGGLWTTLFLRTIVGAFSITIICPFVVFGVVFGAISKLAPESLESVWAYQLVSGALIAYGVGGILFARWQLLRAQDTQWTGGTISFPQLRLRTSAATTARSNVWWTLLRKEVQLQQAVLVIAVILFVVHLGSFLLRGPAKGGTHTSAQQFAMFIPALWLALPLLIGSTAVAEERRLGTLETLLTQPVSRRLQLLIKAVATLILAILLGSLVPWMMELIATKMGLATFVGEEGHKGNFPVTLFVALAIVVIAFVNSTVGRNTIDAFCITIATSPIVFGFVSLLTEGRGYFAVSFGALTPYICALVIAPALLVLLWRNFQQVQMRWSLIISTWVVLIISGVVAWGAATFTWQREWEKFMSLEPKHGPARMHIDDGAKVISVANGAMVLLPDHRLWIADLEFDIAVEEDKGGKAPIEHTTGARVKGAKFAEGTWLDIDAIPLHGYYAIKTDGTLWTFPVVRTRDLAGKKTLHYNPARPMGTDTNWAALTGGHAYVLALKRDGSLWGWGDNDTGVLGPGDAGLDLTPRRVWPNTEWIKVFASKETCLGVKADGTTWIWGGGLKARTFVNDGNHVRAVIEDYSPIRSAFEGTNWTSFNATSVSYLATRADGTLWASVNHGYTGHHWTVFGEPIDLSVGMRQVGTNTNWFTLASSEPLSALTTDGKWLIDQHELSRPEQTQSQLSRYSDWIAISTSKYDRLLGLAADGTVSCWMLTDPYPYYTWRTRAPTWSTNVFATR